MKDYTLIKENGKYGVNKGKENVLSCAYDAIWRFSDSLIGFRAGDYYGIYSLIEDRVIIKPYLKAEFIFFKQYDSKCGKARFRSAYGIHSEETIYIEKIHQLLKEDGLTIADNEGSILLISDNGEVKTIGQQDNEEVYDDYYFKLQYLSFIETVDGDIVKYLDNELPFLTQEDKELHNSQHPFKQAITCIKFMKYVDQVLKDMNIERFDWKHDPELPKYREFIYDAIPTSILDACKKHLSYYYEIEPDSEEYTRRIIKIAWLYANNFVIRFEDGIEATDGRHDYEDPDEDDNILNNIHGSFDLDKIIPYLKISSITQGYLPVLVFQN